MTPDLLRCGLKLIFCGYNPSLRSGEVGHHYAHPGNRFWRVLAAAGITERVYAPSEDQALLEQGIGFTNLVARPTRRADELDRAEIRAGAAALRSTLERTRPRVVAYAGIGVYRWFVGRNDIAWGVQPAGVVPDVIDVVLPSPSGLNRMTIDELVLQYRALVPLIG